MYGIIEMLNETGREMPLNLHPQIVCISKNCFILEWVVSLKVFLILIKATLISPVSITAYGNNNQRKDRSEYKINRGSILIEESQSSLFII